MINLIGFPTEIFDEKLLGTLQIENIKCYMINLHFAYLSDLDCKFTKI